MIRATIVVGKAEDMIEAYKMFKHMDFISVVKMTN